MGPKLYPRTHLLWLRHSKLDRASKHLAVGSIEWFFFDPDQQLRIWARSKITLLDRGPKCTVTMFFGSHVLRLKAEHYTSSLQSSWLLPTPPVDEYRLTLWQWAQKQAPDTILPIVQWRCRLQSPRSLAFISCKFAALYTSIRCHQTQHATSFYIWTSQLCSSCALYICIYFNNYIYTISLYIFILYMPISVYCFLYLSRMFLAHVLRPNSFHRCSNFTSHCRSFTSLPHKRLRKHAHAFFPLPCMFPSSPHLFPHSWDL